MQFMAEAGEPSQVKLICGMISSDVRLFDEAGSAMEATFGRAELVSEVMDFDFTHYYDEQMGSPLYRRFVAFAGVVRPDCLIEAKRATNAIERDFAATCAGEQPGAPRRPINLDPGYVAPGKLVLASMKDFSHRIYLGRGVYAEVTLTYRNGRWQPTEWTFPDYASGRYDAFLSAARELLCGRTMKERAR